MQFGKSILIAIFINLIFLTSSSFALQSGGFFYTELNGKITITGYDSCESVIEIPSTIDGKPVVSIGDEAFWGYTGCNNFTSITIPSSVTSIGDSAFQGCTSLVSISIGGSISSIGKLAFLYCSALTKVSISAGVTSIGKFAFAGCSSLATIEVMEGNPSFSSQDGVLFNKAKTVLLQYPSVKSGHFTIPDSVTHIGDRAFYKCTGIVSVTIPSSVTSIGDFSFEGCSRLGGITISCSAANIGKAAFRYCTSLKFTHIEGVAYIGSQAFYGCTSLQYVAIYPSVTSIGSYAFGGCGYLSSIYFYGNAPLMGEDVFNSRQDNFCIYYKFVSKGFTNPWYGYRTRIFFIEKERNCPALYALGEGNPSLDKLRSFRDNTLEQSAIGRKMIQLYYNNADTINSAFENSPALREAARRMLEVIAPMVGKK